LVRTEAASERCVTPSFQLALARALLTRSSVLSLRGPRTDTFRPVILNSIAQALSGRDSGLAIGPSPRRIASFISSNSGCTCATRQATSLHEICNRNTLTWVASAIFYVPGFAGSPAQGLL